MQRAIRTVHLGRACVIMYVDLEAPSRLRAHVRFDWRLVAERGLRRFGHIHGWPNTLLAGLCELNFLSSSSAKARFFSRLDRKQASQTSQPLTCSTFTHPPFNPAALRSSNGFRFGRRPGRLLVDSPRGPIQVCGRHPEGGLSLGQEVDPQATQVHRASPQAGLEALLGVSARFRPPLLLAL